MINTPLKATPIVDASSKFKFVSDVTLLKPLPLRVSPPIETEKLPCNSDPVTIKFRVKCAPDGAALPTVQTGLPSGLAVTTLPSKRATTIDEIIILITILANYEQLSETRKGVDLPVQVPLYARNWPPKYEMRIQRYIDL